MICSGSCRFMFTLHGFVSRTRSYLDSFTTNTKLTLTHPTYTIQSPIHHIHSFIHSFIYPLQSLIYSDSFYILFSSCLLLPHSTPREEDKNNNWYISTQFFIYRNTSYSMTMMILSISITILLTNWNAKRLFPFRLILLLLQIYFQMLLFMIKRFI